MAKFSVEDKLWAVQRYLQGNDSYRTLGVSFGIDSSLLKTYSVMKGPVYKLVADMLEQAI
jgi:hypothetical protein